MPSAFTTTLVACSIFPVLTASQSQDVFSRAVNTGNIEQATSVVVNADGMYFF